MERWDGMLRSMLLCLAGRKQEVDVPDVLNHADWLGDVVLACQDEHRAYDEYMDELEAMERRRRIDQRL